MFKSWYKSLGRALLTVKAVKKDRRFGETLSMIGIGNKYEIETFRPSSLINFENKLTRWQRIKQAFTPRFLVSGDVEVVTAVPDRQVVIDGLNFRGVIE